MKIDIDCFSIDKLRKNNRVYNQKNLKNAIDAYKELFIASKTSIGEFIDSQSIESIINMENASHIITDLILCKNGMVEGKIQILNTPRGKQLEEIIHDKERYKIFPRMYGAIDNNGNVDIHRIISFDIIMRGAKDL